MLNEVKLTEEAEIKTVLANDIDFTGELFLEEPLVIKGKIKGEIKAHSFLLVDASAEVQAHISGVLVEIRGKVQGNIEASEKIILRATAYMDGDVTAPEVVMESGSHLNGICTMTGKDKK